MARAGHSTSSSQIANRNRPASTSAKPFGLRFVKKTSGRLVRVWVQVRRKHTRTDGLVQVTYNGWPLYLYRDYEAPDDVNGHDALNAWIALGPNNDAADVTE